MVYSLVVILSLLVAVERVRGDATHGSIYDRPKSFPEELKYSVEADKCTAIAVSKGASVGGPMTTHTNDCSDCDFRINKVPARDWPEGSMRPLYLLRGAYPSLIDENRGSTWKKDNLEGSPSQIEAWSDREAVYNAVTGHIPQVPHTYALFEGQYGIMNEHQVAIGESTCAAKLWAAPSTAGGKAIMEAKMMTQIALERSTTARQAVQIMGDLATTYGFYAAEWVGGDISLGEGGEALTVIDKTEAWVFHVLADDTGTSAVWAAQRVPDGHVAAVANQFIIRQVIPNHPDFLYSANLWEVAERQKFWNPADGLLDFLKTYSPMRAHSQYATRRVWRIFNIVAPHVKLNPYTDSYGTDYPFSMRVEKPLTPVDVMNIQRDHYEGTEFDMTKGLAAGPYGDPNRFDPAPVDNMTFEEVLSGAYQRSISLFRTAYSFVAQSREGVPDELTLLWFGPHAPSSTSYTPLYLNAEDVPDAFKRGSLFKYDEKVAWWNFAAVGNYAARFYRYAMVDVRAVQEQLMAQSLAAVAQAEAAAVSLLQQGKTVVDLKDLLTKTVEEQATGIVTRWRNLLFEIITRYHDGYIAENLDTPDIYMHKLFYTKEWLTATGYFKAPANSGPGVIMFASNPTDGMITMSQSNGRVFTAVVFTSFFVCFFTVLGVKIFQKKSTRVTYGADYMPVDNL